VEGSYDSVSGVIRQGTHPCGPRRGFPILSQLLGNYRENLTEQESNDKVEKDENESGSNALG
jgi:hypothetical protein